jgi:hypothetical protein
MALDGSRAAETDFSLRRTPRCLIGAAMLGGFYAIAEA